MAAAAMPTCNPTVYVAPSGFFLKIEEGFSPVLAVKFLQMLNRPEFYAQGLPVLLSLMPY